MESHIYVAIDLKSFYTRLCPETCRKWNENNGRCCQMFHRQIERLSQSRITLQIVWDQRRAADRPCLGLGAMYHRGNQIL